ncbi:hypothetical protein BDV39DRAFT_70193 [Aspergillus sergii]|uniref:Uncharacterized protein n=1 Tax=Aspergillus sergii TaxID=1034303 RepID=A0A5N6X573_9EURO|nr:hypothetical protein BDV39DRAFT_70193 [Aspergillus sergii]
MPWTSNSRTERKSKTRTRKRQSSNAAERLSFFCFFFAAKTPRCRALGTLDDVNEWSLSCFFSFLLFSLPLKSVRISKKRKQDKTCIISRRWIEVHGRRETTEEGSSGLREDPRHLGDTTNVEDAVFVSRRVKNGWGSIP